jgi:eukaryotic-like serine/threonine-protein kinase
LLAACRGEEKAYEDPLVGHSIFTSQLLAGLLGDAADSAGEVTVTSLYDYASREVQRSGLQEPVFRGDIAGRMVLGTGLVPRTRPQVTEERILEIERLARKYVEDYQAKMGPIYSNLSEWKASGSKLAAQMLEPILQWFEKQLIELPQLKSNPAFRAQQGAAIQRQAALCSIDPGTVCLEGVLEKQLGTGAFGTVWRVDREPPHPPLAYKVYHSQELSIMDKVSRFRRGYDAMLRLDHPHIVRVQKFTRCPLGFYMDFIDGPNLRSFVGNAVAPPEMIAILLTIAETLRHAHKREVTHRDVKPENIILSYDQTSAGWKPFLTDFDLAWFPTATQITKEAMGVVNYAAPEQLSAPGSAGAHSSAVDTYAFAQLSFFAITSSNPIPMGIADNKKALAERIRNGWLADAASEFVNLYSDCSATKPTLRPNFDAICERLFRISQLLSEIPKNEILEQSRFVREIIFSMIGLSSDYESATGSFLTLSKKTRVTVQLHRVQGSIATVAYEFQCQEEPILAGIVTFADVRKTLVARIDGVLKNFPDTRRRGGSQAPFQSSVEHGGLQLNLNGVAVARSLISRVLDVIEGK